MKILTRFEEFELLFNRSKTQVLFLRNLCKDETQYILLEEAIKNNFIYSCPSDVEEVSRILNLKSKNDFSFEVARKFFYEKQNLIARSQTMIGIELDFIQHGICKILEIDLVFYKHVEDNFDCLMTVKIKNSLNENIVFKKRILVDYDFENLKN